MSNDVNILDLPSSELSLKKVVDEILLTDLRFNGMAAFMINIEYRWSRQIPTACAGHGFIFFNPDWYDELPKGTRPSIIRHEVDHLILRHLDRMIEGYDPYLANQAQDHVINLAAIDDGFEFKGPKTENGCFDPKFRGMSSEQVYKILLAEQKEQKKNGTAGPPSNMETMISVEKIMELIEAALGEMGQGVSIEKQIEAAEEAVEDHQNEVLRAEGKNPGSQPGAKLIILEKPKGVQLVIGATYPEIFKDYLTDPLGGASRTMLRPSRRTHGMNSPLILPGRLPRKGKSNRLEHLVYGLDVSGSISHKMVMQFHSSVATIKDMLNPRLLTVIFWDTSIVLERQFSERTSYNEIRVNAGGGTNLGPLYARTAEINPEALVIFTDLRVRIPPKPKWDTIWLIPDTNCPIPNDLYGDLYLIPDKGI